MASLKNIGNKALILLKLIDNLKKGPVIFPKFLEEFNLSKINGYIYLKSLEELGLDIWSGEKYQKKEFIYLASNNNLEKVVEELEQRAMRANLIFKKVETDETEIPDLVRFSEEDIKKEIEKFGGCSKSKKEVLKGLESILHPRSTKEKILIIETYYAWRNEFMRYGYRHGN